MGSEKFTARLGKKGAFPITPFYDIEAAQEPAEDLRRGLQIQQAHVVMLAEQSIIAMDNARVLLQAILDLERQSFRGFEIDPTLGLHMSVERYLVEKLGPDVAGTLNTGRSANDLYPAHDRMLVRDRINRIVLALIELKQSLLDKAVDHIDTVMPGYTHHSQHAQPITFGHYLMAGHDACCRDIQRLEQAYERVNLSPMGGAALATTGFPINRARVAELLAFDDIVVNSLDATGHFDYFVETTAAIAIALSNVGRLAEGLYLWNTLEFGMVEVADEYCSISSIMPQKRNPVAFEMIRGEAILVASRLNGMLDILKAIPIGGGREWSYVPRLFPPCANTALGVLSTMMGIVSTLKVNKDVMARRALEGFSTVTELADRIVRTTGLSFRQAHHIVGLLTLTATRAGKKANEITSKMVDIAAQEVIGRPLRLDDATIKLALDPVENVRIRSIIGGPSPEEVLRAINVGKGLVGYDRQRLAQRQGQLEEGTAKLAAAVKEIAGEVARRSP